MKTLLKIIPVNTMLLRGKVPHHRIHSRDKKIQIFDKGSLRLMEALRLQQQPVLFIRYSPYSRFFRIELLLYLREKAMEIGNQSLK